MSCKSFVIKHILLLSLAGLLVLSVAFLVVAPGHLPYSEWPKDLRIRHIASCVGGSCRCLHPHMTVGAPFVTHFAIFL